MIKMSLGITSLNANRNYIDTTSINEVAKQIFTRAQNKTFDINNADLSKFRRPELGLDLYSGRTDANTATKIAVRNAGLDINLNDSFIANVQYLNTQAAMAPSRTSKNVEGKLIAPVAEGEAAQKATVEALPQNVELVLNGGLDKDKRGSNPFSFFSMNANANKDKQEEKQLGLIA